MKADEMASQADQDGTLAEGMIVRRTELNDAIRALQLSVGSFHGNLTTKKEHLTEVVGAINALEAMARGTGSATR